MERKITKKDFRAIMHDITSNFVNEALSEGVTPVAFVFSSMIISTELTKILFEDSEEITIVKEGG